MELQDNGDLLACEENLEQTAKMEKLVLRVYRDFLDHKVLWETKALLVSLEKMDSLEHLEILDLEEIQAKMEHLELMDHLDLLVQWEKEVLQVPRELEDSRACQEPLENLDSLVKMVWLDYLGSLV